MKFPHHLTTLLLLPITLCMCCMHYHATLPFAPHLPVEASISDNGKVTCWLHKSYEEHSIEQGIFQKSLLVGERLSPSLAAPSILLAQRQKEEKAKMETKKGIGKKGMGKRSGEERIRLTEIIPLKSEGEKWGSREVQKSIGASYFPSSSSDEKYTYKSIPGTHITLTAPAPKSASQNAQDEAHTAQVKIEREQRKNERIAMGETEEEMWGLDDEGEYWMKWWFECLEGYRARMEPGGKQVVYWANGHDYFFSPKEWEDQGGERWVYKSVLWCAGGKGEEGEEGEKRVAGGKEKDRKVEEEKPRKISLSR